MAAILYHMTLKLLGQIKVNKMYLCIIFIPYFYNTQEILHSRIFYLI